MTISEIQDGIYKDDDIDEKINDIDAIIFDCDGVLIDITKSYDTTIQKTTQYILQEYLHIPDPTTITFEIIDKFKETGGFNDEVDLTFASVLILAAANKLKKPGEEFIFQAISNANDTGIESVQNYLDSLNIDLSNEKKILDYPGNRNENLVYSIFDQLFYGPELYTKLFNKKSKFSEPGLIENDNVIITLDLIKKLKNKFHDKIAIVSGRGIESVRYSLKDLLNEFDITNSMFLEDESRTLAKPNPESLIRSIKGLDSMHCLFVGDSMEDLIMANEATRQGCKTTFCGIYGTSKHPESKLNFFKTNGASLLIDSINAIPNTLNLV